MDPHRFDSFAKQFSTRLSRRDALRAGAALGAVTLFRGSTALAQSADTTVKDRFISIRTYPYTGPIADAATGLKGLVPVMEQQPGFISIDFVDGNNEIHVVATFLDKTSAVAAAKAEDAWIGENAAQILAGKPTIHSGPTFLRSELHTGCSCTTGTTDPCGSNRLVCCGTTNLDGGPGICLTEATTCPATNGPTPTATVIPVVPTVAPTEAPVDLPTDVPACTGDGCTCIAGTDGACDEGLTCCGASEPGGSGICQSDCSGGGCTSEGCSCLGGYDDACDPGLTCCGAGEQGIGTCLSDCSGTCTGNGCACVTGVEGVCDPALTCCATENNGPGSPGSCVPLDQCGFIDPCPGGEGCNCTEGTEGACDGNLVCCGADVPGGDGTCQTACD